MEATATTTTITEKEFKCVHKFLAENDNGIVNGLTKNSDTVFITAYEGIHKGIIENSSCKCSIVRF